MPTMSLSLTQYNQVAQRITDSPADYHKTRLNNENNIIYTNKISKTARKHNGIINDKLLNTVFICKLLVCKLLDLTQEVFSTKLRIQKLVILLIEYMQKNIIAKRV